jgi:nitrogen fixation NifU-like protein
VSLDELYREVILDHYRNPRHRGRLEHPDAHAEGSNPLCGDEISLDLSVEDDTVVDVAITGQGCSISQASASMMAEAIMGKKMAEIEAIFGRFRAMMDIEEGDPGLDPSRPGEALGDIESLQGVRRFPVRIKCASLPWTTLQEALSEIAAGDRRGD